MRLKLNCILLIDDDGPTNFIHELIIKKTACAEHVRITHGVEEALAFLTKKTGNYGDEDPCRLPDLILLDINMPKFSGWDFLDEYRKLPDEQKNGIVIVMLTTSLNPEDERRAQSYGEVSGFISKPLTRTKLLRLLEEHF